MPGRSKYIILLFNIYFAIAAFGQEPASIHLLPKDGLPSRTIYCIAQDVNGYIWLGTQNGICRYDGINFKSFQHPNFRDNEILQITPDRWGRIWFLNLSNQLFFWDNNKIYEVDLSELSKLKRVRYITITDDHLILSYDVEKYQKLVYLDLNVPLEQIEIFKYPKVFKIGSPLANIDNEIFFSTLSDYVHFKIDKKNGPTSKRLPNISDWIQTIESKNYIDFGDGRLNNIYGFREKIKRSKNSLPGSNNFAQKINGKYWFLTKKGIYQFNDEKEEFELLLFEGLNCNSIIKDKAGNIWIGTNSNGLYIIRSLDFQQFSVDNSELDIEVAYKFYSDPKRNRLIIGGSNGKITSIDSNEKIINYPSIDEVYIREIHEDKFNNIWFLTDLSLIKSNPELTKFESTPINGVKTILSDSKSNYWLGFFNKTIRTNRQDFMKRLKAEKIEKVPGILSKRTYSIEEDFNLNIWIGSTSGLYYLPDSLSHTPVPSIKIMPQSITAIKQASDSSLWVGTAAEGIFQILKNEVIDSLTISHGLSSNNCKSLLVQGDSVWIGTNKGLNLFNTKTKELSTINLMGNEANNEINDLAIFNKQLWIAKSDGLVTFPLNMYHKNESPPKVHIENVKIWDKDTTLQDSLFLEYNQNNLQIDFTGLGFRSAKNISYKYRLKNIDPEWVSTKTRTIRYPSVTPGNYLFEVYAINEDGIRSTIPARIRFIIALPWWRTWWAIATGILLLVTSTWYLFSRRIQRIKKNEQLKQTFTEKVNELRHEALQTQMNPHFIFNALNAIQHFITNQDEEPALQYLSRFARLIRMIFEFSKMKNISIEDEISFIKNYLLLENLRFQDKVKVDFQIHPSLQNQDFEINIPPLLIQPIIENAFKHGLFHRNGDGILKIELSKTKTFIVCTIEDNGIGRHSAKQKKIWIHKHQKSSGLGNVKERLAILNNRTRNFESNDLEIIDLMDTSGKGIGTKVILKIKYNN